MYKKELVNHEVAGTLKDYELTNRVFTNLALSMQESNLQSSDLHGQQKTMYFASVLDMQVLNGGISQYFGNYEHRYDHEVSAALRDLSRHDVADQFEKIAAIIDNDFDTIKSSLKDFDRFYYTLNLQRSMDAVLKDYIIEHMRVFRYDA